MFEVQQYVGRKYTTIRTFKSFEASATFLSQQMHTRGTWRVKQGKRVIVKRKYEV